MECNHRINNFEKAMQELENIKSQSKSELPTGTVRCNGCTLCCHGDAIRLLPEDDVTQYKTVPHDHFKDELMLAHKENGDCVYLSDGGCSIHTSKPQMCREMDCRRLARTVKKKDLKRYNLPLSVWNKGRQMIGRSF